MQRRVVNQWIVGDVRAFPSAYRKRISYLGHDGNLNRPEKHIYRGVSIEDVGFLEAEGSFAFAFNIFTTSDDTIHCHLPQGFKELDPPLDRESEVELKSDYFKPGTIITSEGVERVIVSEDPL